MAANDWITGLQRSIDYIEDHLLEDIDYDAAAAQSFSSSFHFQRIFSILCGYTLGEYIRNRRLSLAGTELAVYQWMPRETRKIQIWMPIRKTGR